jgi:hypothetical protein
MQHFYTLVALLGLPRDFMFLSVADFNGIRAG